MLSPQDAALRLRAFAFEGRPGRFDPEDEKTVLELPFTRTGDFTDAEWTEILGTGVLFTLTEA